MVKYGCVLLVHRILKSTIPQLKNKSMNGADFLYAGYDGSFWLEHESCSLFLGLNTGAPLRLYYTVVITCYVAIIVTLDFPRLILIYFSVSCCH